jgi:hypothetical protein
VPRCLAKRTQLRISEPFLPEMFIRKIGDVG